MRGLFSRVHLAPSANTVLSPHPRQQTTYSLSAHFVSPFSVPSPSLMLLVVLLFLLLSSSPPDSLTVLQCNAGGLRARSSEFFPLYLASFCGSYLYPTLTRLPFFGSLDILFCDLLTLVPGLVLFLPMARSRAVA